MSPVARLAQHMGCAAPWVAAPVQPAPEHGMAVPRGAAVGMGVSPLILCCRMLPACLRRSTMSADGGLAGAPHPSLGSPCARPCVLTSPEGTTGSCLPSGAWLNLNLAVLLHRSLPVGDKDQQQHSILLPGQQGLSACPEPTLQDELQGWDRHPTASSSVPSSHAHTRLKRAPMQLTSRLQAVSGKAMPRAEGSGAAESRWVLSHCSCGPTLSASASRRHASTGC